MNYYTIKQIEGIFCPPFEVVDVRKENKWIAIELSNFNKETERIYNMRVKIRNF